MIYIRRGGGGRVPQHRFYGGRGGGGMRLASLRPPPPPHTGGGGGAGYAGRGFVNGGLRANWPVGPGRVNSLFFCRTELKSQLRS